MFFFITNSILFFSARLINALAVKYDCHDASGNLVQTVTNVIAKNEERGHALTTECANLVEGYANEWSASTDTFSTETTKVIPEEKAKQGSTDTDAETAFKNVEDVWCTSGFEQEYTTTTNVDEAIDETSATGAIAVNNVLTFGGSHTITLDGTGDWVGLAHAAFYIDNSQTTSTAVFFENQNGHVSNGFEIRSVGSNTELVCDSGDNIYGPGWVSTDSSTTPAKSKQMVLGETVTLYRQGPTNTGNNPVGSFTVTADHLFVGGSACAALGSVADTCELHLKHVDSAIKTVDTNTNYACVALGSTIQDVTSRKANADGAYAIADKHFEEESKLYTDGQERVARNIASKNLFTKCFLTKDALDECNVEEETTYSKEFSKGRAGVVQETAETAADEVHAEAMKKATDEDTTARGLCTDLYNQREAHIESDETLLRNLKPLLEQLNICGGKDGDATDTKRNMFGDNLLQVAASSTSEMQAKCALAKKSVAALLETSASPQGSYVDFESRVTSENKFMNEQKLECDASAAAILADATAAAEKTKQNARTLAAKIYAETTVRLNGERDTYKTEQDAVEEGLKTRNDAAELVKSTKFSEKETIDEEYRVKTSNGVAKMIKAVAGRAEARTAAVELRKHNIVFRTNQLIEDTHLEKMNIDSRSAESKTYCTESLGDLVAESDLVKKINNVFHTGTEDGTGTGGLRVVGDDDLTEEDHHGQLQNVKSGINDIEFDKTDAQEQRLTENDAFDVNELAALTSCDESISGALENGYRGCQTKTTSGRTCQQWTAQSPHTHSIDDNDPSKGIGSHNYCRNPDGEPGGIWCYTTDANKRWEYCDPKQ